MPRRRRKSRAPVPVKIVGDSNKHYDQSENHEGPGREPATVGYGNANFPNRFHFTIRYPHDAPQGEGRAMTMAWNAPYAAKRMLEYIIGDDEPHWPNLHTLVTTKGVLVTCNAPSDRLQENEIEIALNHEYTNAEKSFCLPEKDRRSIDVMLRPWPDAPRAQSSTGRAKVDRGVGSKRPDGKFVSVADICEQLGLEPREGRAALRKAAVKKPEWGWQFPVDSDELEAARKVIKKAAR